VENGSNARESPTAKITNKTNKNATTSDQNDTKQTKPTRMFYVEH
jgi:hypothetical protein